MKTRRFVRMFKPRFAPLVETGAKLQTIRPVPVRRPQPGDIISLRAWEGAPYRSKQRVLREAKVTAVLDVLLTESGIILGLLPLEAADGFAKADGFDSWSDMRDWFNETHGLPFAGILICWSQP
jgi:hypothetical protein